jgi:hypothetical protein
MSVFVLQSTMKLEIIEDQGNLEGVTLYIINIIKFDTNILPIVQQLFD